MKTRNYHYFKYLHRIFPWFHRCCLVIDKCIKTKITDDRKAFLSMFQCHCVMCDKINSVTICINATNMNNNDINIQTVKFRSDSLIDKLGVFKN